MKNKLWIIGGIMIFSNLIFSGTTFEAEYMEKTDLKTTDIYSENTGTDETEFVIYPYNCFETGYLINNNKIFYYDGVKLKKVRKTDIKTFRQIHSFIGRDEKNIYYGAEIVKGLDLKTLEIYSDALELQETEPEVGCYPVIDIKFKDKNGIHVLRETNTGKIKAVKYE